MGWEKAWPGLGGVGSVFWSCDAAEEQGAVPETASGGSSEAQEDSTLSVYDNLNSMSPSQRKEDVAVKHLDTIDPGGHVGAHEEEAELKEAGQKRDSSSSWSSCEVLPLDESPDASPKRRSRLHSTQVASDENSHQSEHDDQNNADDDDDDGEDNAYYPNSPASCSAPSGSPLSTGSSEVFLPSGPPDPQGLESEAQPRDAHSLLAELQQQMARQKAEYQARIQR